MNRNIYIEKQAQMTEKFSKKDTLSENSNIAGQVSIQEDKLPLGDQMSYLSSCLNISINETISSASLKDSTEQTPKLSIQYQTLEVGENFASQERQTICSQRQEIHLTTSRAEQCNICMNEGNYLIVTNKQLLQHTTLLCNMNILVKCDICSFVMCYSCIENSERISLDAQCYQRCGSKLGLLQHYLETKYNDMSIQPFTMNDLIRQSVYNECQEKSLEINDIYIEQLILQLIEKPIINTIKRQLYSCEIIVDLEQNVVLFDLNIPGYKTDKIVQIKYSLDIQNKELLNLTDSDQQRLKQQLIQYIRRKLMSIFNYCKSTNSISLSHQNILQMTNLLKENSKQIDTSKQSNLRYMKLGGTILTTKKQNIYQTKISILNLGLFRQFSDIIQYFLDIDTTEVFVDTPENGLQFIQQHNNIEEIKSNNEDYANELNSNESLSENRQQNKRRKTSESSDYIISDDDQLSELQQKTHNLRSNIKNFDFKFILKRQYTNIDEINQQIDSSDVTYNKFTPIIQVSLQEQQKYNKYQYE